MTSDSDSSGDDEKEAKEESAPKTAPPPKARPIRNLPPPKGERPAKRIKAEPSDEPEHVGGLGPGPVTPPPPPGGLPQKVPEVKAMPRPPASTPMAKPVSHDAPEVTKEEEEEEPSPAQSWPDKSWSEHRDREWEGWEGWEGGWRGYDWSSRSSSSWENNRWTRSKESEPTPPPAWRTKKTQSRRPAVPTNPPKAKEKYSPPPQLPQQRPAAKGGGKNPGKTFQTAIHWLRQGTKPPAAKAPAAGASTVHPGPVTVRSSWPQEAQRLRSISIEITSMLNEPKKMRLSQIARDLLATADRLDPVAVVGAVVGIRAFESLGREHTIQVQLPSHLNRMVQVMPNYNLWPENWEQAMYALPIFGVSFLCHFNALPTHQELERPTRYRMRRVILVTLTLTSLIYLFVSICGYLFAGCFTCGNVLLNFPSDDNLINVARVALGMVLMLNFPLICQPCRNALFRLLNGSGCVKAAEVPLTESLDGARENSSGSFSLEIVSTSTNDLTSDSQVGRLPRVADPTPSRQRSSSPSRPSSTPSSPPEACVHVYRRQDTRGGRGQSSARNAPDVHVFDTFHPKEEAMRQGALEPTNCQRIVLTSLLLGTSLLVSCVMKSIMVVWSVIGSTVSFLIAFILPALFWYKVVGPTVRPWRRGAALGLIALCCVLSAICFVLACTALSSWNSAEN
ncbi:SLC38A10 [Symbiodinium sp. CCMP2456]|nr:SLC38A10 [Symbiodinium sp. CCMP2456]